MFGRQGSRRFTRCGRAGNSVADVTNRERRMDLGWLAWTLSSSWIHACLERERTSAGLGEVCVCVVTKVRKLPRLGVGTEGEWDCLASWCLAPTGRH